MARVTVPKLPDRDEPLRDLLARRKTTSQRLKRHAKAEKWMPIAVNETRPFGVVWFGDPHLDDDGCDWDSLLEHVNVCKRTKGLYAVNIGDSTNNWVGRLVSLYAKQDTKKSDARRLAKWFMKDSGVNWLLWLLGNHDVWNEGDAILSLISDGAVHLPSWSAKIEIRGAGQKWRVHAAHDFRGHSDWNKTHGGLKAAYKASDAELYVCGHRHDWGTQSFEVSGMGRVAHVARARGYKFHDDYARTNGFEESESGQSILTIFNPNARTPAGRILTFADVHAGAEVLKALRKGK